MMDALSHDLDSVIRDAIARAHAAGLDGVTASRRAVEAVRAARPDLTPDEARSLVELSEPAQSAAVS